MRVSVTNEAEDRLSLKRWTARTTDGGRLIFCDYDELERTSEARLYRVKRAWRENNNDARFMREDGVEVLSKPTISAEVKRRLLTAARAQIEWSSEEQ